MEPSDINWPLAMFQATKTEKDDTRKLIQTINRGLGQSALPEDALNETFDVRWPKLEKALDAIPQVPEGRETQRTEREILGELLALARDQAFERTLVNQLSYGPPHVVGGLTQALQDLQAASKESQNVLMNILGTPKLQD